MGFGPPLVFTTEAPGPYTYTDTGGEQTFYEDTATTRRDIYIEFSNRNMAQTGKFRLYRKVDGTNYDLWNESAVAVVAGSMRAFDYQFTTNQHWKLTYEEDADEGADRDIPYNLITQVKECAQ